MTRNIASFLMVGGFLLGVCSSAGAQEKITFDDHVKPLLRQRCASCHNTSKKSGDLDVTSFTALMAGGGSGSAVTPGDVSSSYLFALVNHDEEPYMPPDSPRIPDEEVAMLRGWIEQGALENQSSRARVNTGPRIAAVDASATERPATVVVPGHLPLEPSVVTARAGSVVASHTHPWAPVSATGAAGQVLLHDTRDGSLLGVLPFSEGTINVVRFSRNGALLMAAGGRPGAQGVVAIWDIQTGERVATLDEESDAILAADISPDHRFVVVGGPQKLVRIYRISDDRLIHEIKKHTEWVTAVQYSPDGILIASGDRNGGAFVWEAGTAREYLTLAGHPQSINSLSWRIDSNALATASMDGSVKVWEVENGGQVGNWNAHGGGVQSIEFTRDGRIVTAGRDRSVKIWNQGGQQQAAFAGFSDIATAVTYCDETNLIVAGDWSGTFVAVNAEGQEVARISLTPPTLQSRLEQANAALVAATASWQPEADKLTAMTQMLEQVDAGLVASMTQATESKTDRDARAANIVKWNEEIVVRQQTATTLAGQIAGLVAVIEKATAVNASVAQLNEVSADSKIDELQAAFTQWKSERDAELATAQTQAKENNDALVSLQQSVAAESKKVEELDVLLSQLAPQIEMMTKQSTDLKAAVEALQASVGALKGAVDSAQADVSRWTAELQFVALLGRIDAERSEISEAITSAYAELDPIAMKNSEYRGQMETLASEVAAVTTTRDEQAALMAQMSQSLATLTEAMTGLTTQRDSETVARENLEKGLGALDEAIVSARRAVEMVPGDEELAGALQRLEQLGVEKRAKLVTLSESLTALQAQVDAMQAEMSKQTEAMTAAETMVQTLDQQLVEKKGALVMVEQLISETQSQMDALQQRVEELNSQLEAKNLERRQAQGISS